MATPRCAGGSVVTSISSMKTRPSLTGSNPAIILSRVDFPHPDGPTNTTNSPSSTQSSTLVITAAPANAFVTPASRIFAIRCSLAHALGQDVATARTVELVEKHSLRASQEQFRA